MTTPSAKSELALGSLFSAAGNLAGAFLGQESFSQGDQILPSFNVGGDLALAASNFDALNQIGFGDSTTIPSPSQRLVAQIQALPIDEKTKRRGLLSLSEVLRGEEPTLPAFLQAVLDRVGVSVEDLEGIREQDQQFREQQESLASLGGINAETVLSRARSAQAASDLVGAASAAATGGTFSPLQQDIRDRLSRQIDDFEETALLRGRFGGFNPSQALNFAQEQRQELDLRTIEQSLLLASGITGALNGGLQGSQNAASQSVGANLGALGIAANQAAAANALQQNVNARNAATLGNGVAGAFNSIGEGFTQVGTINALNSPIGGGSSGTGGSAPATGGGGGGGGIMSLFGGFF